MGCLHPMKNNVCQDQISSENRPLNPSKDSSIRVQSSIQTDVQNSSKNSPKNYQKYLNHYEKSNKLNKQRDLQVGIFLDKSLSTNKMGCLKEWALHFDTSQIHSKEGSFNDNTESVQSCVEDELYQAMQRFNQNDPQKFDQLLSGRGGGIFRWSAWRAKLLQEVDESYNFQVLQQQNESDQMNDIAKDIMRTFPKLEALHETQFTKCLSEILNQLCSRFPSLGYCQGMNYVMAFILLNSGGNFTETWSGVYIMFKSHRWMLYGFFMAEFPLVILLSHLTHQSLRINQPLLEKHLIKLGVEDSYLIFKWIITLFLYNLPLQASLNFWDLIITKGIWIIINLNVALLEYFKSDIFECTSDSDVLVFAGGLEDVQSIDYKLIKQRATEIEPLQFQQYQQEASKLKSSVNLNQEAILFLETIEFSKNDQELKINYDQFIERRINNPQDINENHQVTEEYY